MKLTKNEILYGINTRSKPGNSNAERLTWYKARAEQLEAARQTEAVKFARKMTTERIKWLAGLLLKEELGKEAA